MMCRGRVADHRIVAGFLLALLASGAGAAEQAYGRGDIVLGAGYKELAGALDLRYINAALAEQVARGDARPDLGRRGFGCYARGDARADETCVSHEERIGDVPLREVRLQFVDGVLQQFSITADLPHLTAVIAALEAEHGPAGETRPAAGTSYASWRWRNAASTIVAWAGKDVVFVSFELAGYAAAVARRQLGPGGSIAVDPR